MAKTESGTGSKSNRLTTRNAILNRLPSADLERLRAHLVEAELPLRHVSYTAGRPISEVYFPSTVVVSILVAMRSGAMAEVMSVGNEGLVGLAVYFGDDSEPASAIVQVPGRAHILPVRVFSEELARHAALQRIVGSYAHVQMMKALQGAACNQLHSLEQRMCKWLLLTDDRTAGSGFRLTQEFLSLMLGASRPAVSVIAARLRDKGLIEYRHGYVKVLDRKRLKASACECYSVVTSYFERHLAWRLHADGDSQPTERAKSTIP